MSLSWILLIVLLIIQLVCLPSLLTRSGQDGWKGYVPILHWLAWLKMLKRPWWWLLLILVPGVNLIMLTIMHVETSIAFGQRTSKDQWFAGLLPWAFLPKLAFKDKEAEYVGPRDWTGKKKSVTREWGEAIVFAIVAASVIRSFFFEAFTIPTPSMEGSMLVGDYLFVSKMSYGAKTPQTPLSIPFVHNTIPGTLTDSYTEALSLPYFRLPGFGDVERFDPVVFNFPHGDTIVVHPYFMGHDYYSILKSEAQFLAQKGGADFIDNYSTYMAKAKVNLEEKKLCYSCQQDPQLKAANKPVVIGGVKARPIDKCENYVKRCIGLPGEELKIRDQKVLIDNKEIETPEFAQFNYQVTMSKPITEAQLHSLIPFVNAELHHMPGGSFNQFIIALSEEERAKLDGMSMVVSVDPLTFPFEEFNELRMFPNANDDEFNTWTVDNYGPVYIPKAGDKVELDDRNYKMYRRVIESYEGKSIEKRDGQVYIDGQPASEYTFDLNYYWMMGDNRHNSADSRMWGFVPETHVVGKPVFCWMSRTNPNDHGESGFRFERMFRLVD